MKNRLLALFKIAEHLTERPFLSGLLADIGLNRIPKNGGKPFTSLGENCNAKVNESYQQFFFK